MKQLTNFFLFIVILIVISCSKTEKSNSILFFNGSWKVKRGDSLNWASPIYNDSNWSLLKNISDSNKIYDSYDGYAWYRNQFMLSDTLKTAAYDTDSLKLFLGKIDDCDQVYLNGYLLGENNRVAKINQHPDTSFKNIPGFWDKERKYMLSVKDKRILWNKKNVIAIRLFDQFGGGGINGRSPFISMKGPEDDIQFELQEFYKIDNNNILNKNLKIRNLSLQKAFEGDLSIVAENIEHKEELFSSSYKVSLQPGKFRLVPIELPFCTDSIKVLARFKDYKSDFFVQEIIKLPYALN